jgi:hypothetical protein
MGIAIVPIAILVYSTYGHLEFVTTVVLFYIFLAMLIYFSQFWFVVPRIIWQACLLLGVNVYVEVAMPSAAQKFYNVSNVWSALMKPTSSHTIGKKFISGRKKICFKISSFRLRRHFSRDHELPVLMLTRVARSFLLKNTKVIKNITTDHKICQISIKYTKWPSNIPNGNKITNVFRPSKIFPNWDKNTIWQS